MVMEEWIRNFLAISLALDERVADRPMLDGAESLRCSFLGVPFRGGFQIASTGGGTTEAREQGPIRNSPYRCGAGAGAVPSQHLCCIPSSVVRREREDSEQEMKAGLRFSRLRSRERARYRTQGRAPCQAGHEVIARHACRLDDCGPRNGESGQCLTNRSPPPTQTAREAPYLHFVSAV